MTAIMWFIFKYLLEKISNELQTKLFCPQIYTLIYVNPPRLDYEDLYHVHYITPTSTCTHSPIHGMDYPTSACLRRMCDLFSDTTAFLVGLIFRVLNLPIPYIKVTRIFSSWCLQIPYQLSMLDHQMEQCQLLISCLTTFYGDKW